MNVKLKIFCGFLSGVIIGFIFSPVKHGVNSKIKEPNKYPKHNEAIKKNK